MSFEAMLVSARHMTRDVADTASRFIDKLSTSKNDIRRALTSDLERDRNFGVRSVLALVGQGQDTLEFFPEMVKNVNCSDWRTRLMVYHYLVLYCEYEPDLTLMAVNSIQKSFTHNNPLLRAAALKTIASLKIPSISMIVCTSISELLADVSYIVRIACCHAIASCYETNPTVHNILLEKLAILMADKKDARVVGWAHATLLQTFSHRLDLVHETFSNVSISLPQFEEWSIVPVLQLLIRYCRRFMHSGDPRLRPLFESLLTLMYSRNDAIVIFSTAALYYLAPENKFENWEIASHLVNLEQSELVLQNIDLIATKYSTIFKHYFDTFFLLATDSQNVRVLKLKILAKVCDDTSFPRLFKELVFYAKTLEDQPSLAALMSTIAACSATNSRHSNKVLHWLLECIKKNENAIITAESLKAVRHLLQRQTENIHNRDMILHELTRLLVEDPNLHGDSKATILFMLGENLTDQLVFATEALRQSLRGIAYEPAVVRLSVFQLAAKLYVRYMNDPKDDNSRIPQFFDYAMNLGRYDANYDIRDRVRTFGALTSRQPKELVTLLFQASKHPPNFMKEAETVPEFMLGSSSLAVHHEVGCSVPVGPWGSGNTLSRNHPDDETERSPLAASEPSHSDSDLRPKLLSLEEFLNSSSTSEESQDAGSLNDAGNSDGHSA